MEEQKKDLVDAVVEDINSAFGALAAWCNIATDKDARRVCEQGIDAHFADLRVHLRALISQAFVARTPIAQPADVQTAEVVALRAQIDSLRAEVERLWNCEKERDAARQERDRCRAESAAPAPREPDGWMVVGSLCGRTRATVWLSTEGDAERQARSQAAEFGPCWTARPFYLDTPPSTSADEVATLRAEVERMTLWRDRLATEVATIVLELGGEVEGLPTQTINYLQRIRALRAVEADVERLTRDLDLVRGDRDLALALCSEIRAERDSARGLARRCREIAQGERERIAAVLAEVGYAHGSEIVRRCPALALPEVP